MVGYNSFEDVFIDLFIMAGVPMLLIVIGGIISFKIDEKVKSKVINVTVKM